jgi:hypothetical protein
MRVAGSPRDDDLVHLTTVAAQREFNFSMGLNDIVVLHSGFGRKSSEAFQKTVPPERRQGTDALHRLLADGTVDWNAPSSGDKLRALLAPLAGKLLILVAHHSSDDKSVSFSTNDGPIAQVPVDVLRSMVDAEKVNLFLLGCSTGDSAHIGTSAEINTEQAAQGLKNLFLTDIERYSDVFQRLRVDGMELVFDIRFATHRKLETQVDATPSSPKVRGDWVIPEVTGGKARPAEFSSTEVARRLPAIPKGQNGTSIQYPCPIATAPPRGPFQLEEPQDLLRVAANGFPDMTYLSPDYVRKVLRADPDKNFDGILNGTLRPQPGCLERRLTRNDAIDRNTVPSSAPPSGRDATSILLLLVAVVGAAAYFICRAKES